MEVIGDVNDIEKLENSIGRGMEAGGLHCLKTHALATRYRHRCVLDLCEGSIE